MSIINKGLFLYPYRTDPWVPFGKLPPIGLEMVAQSVKDLFNRFDIVDMRFEKDLTPYLKDSDVVCISMPWGREKGVAGGVSKKYDPEFIYKLIHSIPDNKKIVLGGTFAGESSSFIFENFKNVDVIVNGQGEETLREFLLKDSPVNVKGLSYKKNGKIIKNEMRALNILPGLYPDRKLRKYKYYLFGSRFDCIYTSHGCPYKCAYCEFEGSKWNNRSAQDIYNELQAIGDETKFILINDNNFLENPGRAMELLTLMEKNKMKKVFWAQCRTTPMANRPDLVKKLNKMGFVLAMGVESPQDHVLKWLRKGYTRANNDKAFNNLKRTSLILQAYYIIGNYKETKEEIEEITDYSHKSWIDFLCLNRLRCYPQSRLAKMIENLKGIYVDPNDLRVFTDDVSKREITQLLKKISKDFYLSKNLFRTFCKLSFHFNVPLMIRYALLGFFDIHILKRNRHFTILMEKLSRYNILLGPDLLLNNLLKFFGRKIYKITI